MRVIQGPFGEKDFKLFFRTDLGFSSPQDRLATRGAVSAVQRGTQPARS